MIGTVEELDVTVLPRGRVHRLFVEMVHDGLGQPIRVAVLVGRGEKEGPVFGLTSGLHGNELNGIPVIHGLFQRLDRVPVRGTVVAVVGVNVPSILARRRRFPDGVDLNHIMPGKAEGNISEVYAHRFLERIARHFDFLVDLHTASFGRVNSLYVRADMTNATIARMAYLQRPQIIVHNPPNDSTLRGACQALGIPAITVEIGNPQVFQPIYVKRSLVGLRAVLAEVGMLKRRPLTMGPPPVLCDRSAWTYTDRGGLLEVFPEVTDAVEEGEVVARLTSVFGDVIAEYHSPTSGVLIGRSVDPIAETGARIVHIGTVAVDTSRFHLRHETEEDDLDELEEDDE